MPSLRDKHGPEVSVSLPGAAGRPHTVPEGPGPCPAVPRRAGAPRPHFPSGTRGRFLLLWRRLPGPRGNRRLPGESGKRPGCQRARRPLAPLLPAPASPRHRHPLPGAAARGPPCPAPCAGSGGSEGSKGSRCLARAAG